jgi:predicted Zn-ribbon and HTH transcriptional regulator
MAFKMFKKIRHNGTGSIHAMLSESRLVFTREASKLLSDVQFVRVGFDEESGVMGIWYPAADGPDALKIGRSCGQSANFGAKGLVQQFGLGEKLGRWEFVTPGKKSKTDPDIMLRFSEFPNVTRRRKRRVSPEQAVKRTVGQADGEVFDQAKSIAESLKHKTHVQVLVCAGCGNELVQDLRSPCVKCGSHKFEKGWKAKPR